MELVNSKRLLFSANYVATILTPDEQHKLERAPGGAFRKANLVRALHVQTSELAYLREVVARMPEVRPRDDAPALFEALERIAGMERPMTTMALASMLASVSDATINELARLTATTRDSAALTLMLDLYDRHRKISPIGRLHLERLEMYPAGIQKGELVFTVPMAPGETVTISHKEWSTSTSEFEDIVQDFFESYSEKGVAEKSDSSMATENEARHTSALNFGASLSGEYMGVTLTTTFGLASTSDERQSVKNSMQRCREVTEKASARTRKEHKVSVKLEEKRGAEDSAFRTITNPAANAIRVDYYKMMRKWRTDLYRYGLRQTYDIAIPVPGVRLWAQYMRLADLDRRLREPVQFGLAVSAITSANFRVEAARFRAGVPDEPLFQIVEDRIMRTEFLDEGAADQTRFSDMSFDVPAGYVLGTAELTATAAVWAGHPVAFDLPNISDSPQPFPPSGVVRSSLPELIGRSGRLAIAFAYRNISQASVQLHLTYRRQMPVFEAWQRAVWEAIRTAAEARHREQAIALQDERDLLFRALNGRDTLTLRRLEREELLRLVLQWLLGPGHSAVATASVEATILALTSNERVFQTATVPVTAPTFVNVSEAAWSEALIFGELVKFIHQAIEWENLLYFLYPYFWGSETAGRDKLLFAHPDPEHERFLRAGYARVVLTVRPGFETDFTNLIETGSLATIANSPYIPIAQDIANFARTNYAGIPPANPELHARPLLFPEQRATWDTMQAAMKALDAEKTRIGAYPATLDDLPGGPWLDAWGNALEYRMPGLGADYDLLSLGANNEAGGVGLDADISSAAGASLVATWFDYTPTSALDIEVDTKPADIA